MILTWLILLLMAGGLLSWIMARWSAAVSRWIALMAVSADLFIMSTLWMDFREPAENSGSWFIDHSVDWIPSAGISYHVALDGLSMVLLMLTFFLGLLAVLCSWKEVRQRTGFYYFNLLWTLSGITGVFLAMDLFLFYFFWEVMLVPMFFLIGIWGDANRRYAAFKFFIFTQAGGLLMLLSILALYFIHGAQSGNYTFDYFSLLQTTLSSTTAKWIMAGFLVAFIVKLPAVPFHNWLPDAHSEAPTAGSVILAGLLLKTGAYGIIRFVLTLFPVAAAEFAWWAMCLGVAGIIYGALLAFAQTDLKRLIAYTSISHMGFVLIGIFSFNELALQGVVMQLLTHGISAGALFATAGMLKERLHTRDIGQMGGLWSQMPTMGVSAILFTMASLGLPLLGNFIAEFLILLGVFQLNAGFAVIASTGLIFSALYSLRMLQKVFLGPAKVPGTVRDFNGRELFIMSSLALGIIVLGVYPQPVMDMVRMVLERVTASL